MTRGPVGVHTEGRLAIDPDTPRDDALAAVRA